VLTTVPNTAASSSCSSINRVESSQYKFPPINSAPSLTPLEGALGVEVVDVYKVDIPVARRKELSHVTGSDWFRSQHQACAIELSSQRKSDLLVALGSGGGASLLFTLCAVNKDEEKLTTIVTVPSVLRLNSLRNRLNKARISVREWTVKGSKNLTRPPVLLVLAKTAVTKEFKEFFLELCREKAVARLVFDRIESFVNPPLLTLVTSFKFREKLPEGLVPFIGTSTSLPLGLIAKVMRQMSFRHGNTQLVRDPSLLHNSTSYSVFPLTSQRGCPSAEAFFSPTDDKLLSVLNYVRHALGEFQEQDRALIFCSSSRVAEDFAAELPCFCYAVEANGDANEFAMKSWRAGDVKALATTSGLGVDFDYPYIKLVIHYEEPRNIFAFLHESGKAGRNLQRAYVTTFWHVEKMPASNTDDLGVDEMIEYLMTGQCRRTSLLLEGNTCHDDATAALCDNCQSQLAHVPIVSL